MEIQEIRHTTINGRYEFVIERAAVKNQDGFKVSVHSDSLQTAKKEAQKLYDYAINLTRPDAKIGEEVKS